MYPDSKNCPSRSYNCGIHQRPTCVCVPIILHERIYFVCSSGLCAEGIPRRGKCVISFAVPSCSLFGMFALCVLFCLYILPIRALSHCKYGEGTHWKRSAGRFTDEESQEKKFFNYCIFVYDILRQNAKKKQ